jgi:hypothetical protein
LGACGETTEQLVADSQRTDVPGRSPKKNCMASGAMLKPVPVSVTVWPPEALPELGEAALTEGAAPPAMYSKRPPELDCRPWTVTRTAMTPEPAGATAKQVRLSAHDAGTVLVPNWTVVSPAVAEKSLPVSVTTVPPAAGPLPGETPVTIGVPDTLTGAVGALEP